MTERVRKAARFPISFTLNCETTNTCIVFCVFCITINIYICFNDVFLRIYFKLIVSGCSKQSFGQSVCTVRSPRAAGAMARSPSQRPRRPAGHWDQVVHAQSVLGSACPSSVNCASPRVLSQVATAFPQIVAKSGRSYYFPL